MIENYKIITQGTYDSVCIASLDKTIDKFEQDYACTTTNFNNNVM